MSVDLSIFLMIGVASMKVRYNKYLPNHLPKSFTVKQLSMRLTTLDPRLKSACGGWTAECLMRAHHVVRSLLLSLPNHLDEVSKRSESLPLFTIRVVGFSLVDHNLLTLEEADQLAPLFRVIGLGSLDRALMKWFRQEQELLREYGEGEDERSKIILSRLERGLSILFHCERGQELFESLHEQDRVRLSGPWVRPMMRLAKYEIFPQYALCALFKSTSDQMRAKLIIQFEKCRRKVRAKPLPIYEKLLTDLAFDELDLLFAYLASTDELKYLESILHRQPLRVQVAYERTQLLTDEVS